MIERRQSRRLAYVLLTLLFALLTACVARPPVDGPPKTSTATPRTLPPDATPRAEPRSRYGNPPHYEVFGVRYNVQPSSYGYKERGVASWYGKKFHGKLTSSREPYDMYAMTAAHKTLPLPTYVRVRNLRNNKSIVVRVNDRGPFVHNRVIDLSYSAALKLDMVRDGTSLVEVTALSFDEPPKATKTAAGAEETTGADNEVFVQVGAFGDSANAKRRFDFLRRSGIGNSFVHRDREQTPSLYRIRIGPIANVDEYDALIAKLDGIGITESHLVTN